MRRSKNRSGWRERLGAFFSGKESAGASISLLKAGLCITFIACSAAALVWPHLEMVKIGYRLAHLENQRDKLIQDRRVLRIEVAALRQLDRIESIARKKWKWFFQIPGK